MATSSRAEMRTRGEREPGPNPLLTGALYGVTDTLCLAIAPLGGYQIWRVVNPDVPSFILNFWPALPLFWATFAVIGLYPAIGITPVEELRRLVNATALVYMLLTVGIFASKAGQEHSRGVFLLSGLLTVVLLPLGRALVCFAGSKLRRWGAPVVVLGGGQIAEALIRELKDKRSIGLIPVACFDDAPRGHECAGVTVCGPLSQAVAFGQANGIRHAIVTMPGIGRQRTLDLIEDCSVAFPHVIVIPDLLGMSSLWIVPRDLGGILGLELKHNLLLASNRVLKRVMDVCAAVVGSIIAVPVVFLCAVWIRLVSRGPVLYWQEREGEGESMIRIPKLRTMHTNADDVLDEYLAENPVARRQWERSCKLRDDPRILPGVGRFLRRTSLDELPQLWNILIGEMSLVGPRPFPSYHNGRFTAEFRRLRRRVKPGLTGLWQVSARSDGDLDVQVKLDTYYIKNWSIWLDIYIAFRTIRTVLTQEGAY